MKKLLFSMMALALLAGCATKDKTNTSTGDKDTTATTTVTNPTAPANADTSNANDPNATTIEWLDPVVKELGKLKKDQAIEITYRFKNTGDKPLVIENVTAQCGCTIPEKPEQPFAPGEEGVIKAKFNGIGSGTISKQVYVTANTKPAKSHTLTFTGDLQ